MVGVAGSIKMVVLLEVEFFVVVVGLVKVMIALLVVLMQVVKVNVVCWPRG